MARFSVEQGGRRFTIEAPDMDAAMRALGEAGTVDKKISLETLMNKVKAFTGK